MNRGCIAITVSDNHVRNLEFDALATVFVHITDATPDFYLFVLTIISATKSCLLYFRLGRTS